MTTTEKYSKHAEAQKTYVENELKQLLGGKIVAYGAIVEDDLGFPEVWPVLHILLPNGEKLEVSVSRDEEGNGPGHLFIVAI